MVKQKKLKKMSIPTFYTWFNLWCYRKHFSELSSFAYQAFLFYNNNNNLFLYAATQATYTRPTVSPSIGARISASSGGTTYVKTTSGSIITVVPKSLATLGGKIISSNIVSGASLTRPDYIYYCCYFTSSGQFFKVFSLLQARRLRSRPSPWLPSRMSSWFRKPQEKERPSKDCLARMWSPRF